MENIDMLSEVNQVDFTEEPVRLNYFPGHVAIHGYGVFDDEKLTFYPGRVGEKHFEQFRYADMAGAEAVNLMFVSPTGVRVNMKDGTSFRLAVMNRNAFLPWLQETIETGKPPRNLEEGE